MSDDLALRGSSPHGTSPREPALVERAVTALTIVAMRSGTAAAKFGVTLFIARYLDLEALGFFGLVSGATVIGPVLAGFGIIGVLSRESVGREAREVAAALVPYWILVAALYAALAAACLPWAALHGRGGLLLLVAALVFVEHLNVDVVVILNTRGRPRLANLLLSLRTLGWIGAYVGLALLIPSLRSVEALLAFWLAGACAALVAFGLAARDWHWRAALAAPGGAAGLRALVRRSRTYFLNELANTGGQYLDRYIVGVFLGLEAAGVYFLFWSVTNALSNVVNTSLLQVHQPAIILARAEPGRQGRLLGALRTEAGLASLALALATAAVALIALNLFPRPAFTGHEAVLLVLLAGFVLRIVYEIEGVGLYARHEDANTLLSALIVLGVSLAVTAALTPFVGLLGPAVAVVVSYLAGWLWRWRRNGAVLAAVPHGIEEAGSGREADVALFMPTLIGGGAERVQLILAAYFLGRGMRVDVVVCKRIGALRDRVPAGARLVSLDGRRVLLSLRRYERYLRAARPPVVISSVENASVIACLARARGAHPHRLIVRQDNALVAAPTAWGEPRRWPWLVLLALVYRFADRLVAVSRGVEAQLEDLLGRGRLDGSGPRLGCVHNPVIAADFAARLRGEADGEGVADASPEVDASWAEPGVPLVAAAGRLSPVKDYPTLLRAFARVRRRRPARLVVMGEGDARPALEALCVELGIAGDVRFAGFVANPLPTIARADVFVLSSLSEGLPGVLIEALAAGTPVVSTDCRHGPREVLGEGRFGRLVPVGDAAALADAIEATLAAPRPAPSGALRDHLARYSLDHVGGTYLSLLAEPAGSA